MEQMTRLFQIGMSDAWLVAQCLYAFAFLVDFYIFSLPANMVDPKEKIDIPESQYPYIVLYYPVLRELEATMRTTFTSLTDLQYPKDRYRVVAIPNANDLETVASLERLKTEFSFLQIVAVPPTTDPRWAVVWDAWERNPKAYWWHQGGRAKVKDLPPKKTRQLIYAFYNMVEELADSEPDFVINYIDADSCPPPDHFLDAVRGLRRYDLLQAQNVAGNLNMSAAATFHAYDHMSWDGHKYPHLTGNGRQPFWVLGKGLFFKAKDLVALGGFHPWITIEDQIGRAHV